MSPTPSFTAKKLVRLLRSKGFELDRTKGSHQLWINREKGKRVIVPMHNKDLPKGTLYAILRHAGIDRDQFEV